MTQLEFPRRWLRPLVAGAVIYGVYRIVQTVFFGPRLDADAMPAAHRIANSVADGTIMALLAPVAWALSRRFPIGPPSWARNIVIHVVTAFAFGVAWIVAMLAWFALISGKRFEMGPMGSLFGWLTANFFAYFVAVAVLHAFAFQRSARQRELDAALLRAELTTARLETLRAQLHPHFLFNTLNTISELIHIDPPAADAMVVRLAELLRATLDLSAEREVTIAREIEVVSTYLELQRMRYGDRLVVHTSLDRRAASALVPPLITQPLVENALRHGISRRSTTGTVWLTAGAHDERLRIVIEDDGVGLPETVREGVGLANVRTRLAELFGESHRLALAPRPGGGTIATIEMPYRTATVSP